jgi:hypothetical protein
LLRRESTPGLGGEFIDGESGGHGVTPIDLSLKSGEAQRRHRLILGTASAARRVRCWISCSPGEEAMPPVAGPPTRPRVGHLDGQRPWCR